MKANQDSTAGEDNSSVSDNLSSDALIRQLTEGNIQEVEADTETEEVSEEEPEQELEEASGLEEAEEATEDEEEAEASDEIDLLNLEPEQIQALAKKGKSRLLERIGELTAQKKALQAQLEQTESKPQAKVIPKEQNPFGNLNTAEEISAKYEAFEGTLETTDRLLEEYEDYSLDDIIEVGDQQFTKKQIRLANRNARDAIAKYLPAQAAHLQKLESYKTANQQWQEAAKAEVPEINDEESEIGKAYSQLVNDPLVKQLKESQPELGVQIEYILAHAARSKFGTAKKVMQGAGQKLKVKPPASPVGAGASRQGQGQSSKYAEAMKRFEQSGSAEDWIAAQKYK